MILAGDIGGTNTRLALFEIQKGRLVMGSRGSLPSREFPGLAEAIASFLPAPKPSLDAAGFGVAGPVSAGRVKVTNLPWVVDPSDLWRFLGTPAIRILNDLEAMAWGIELLGSEDFVTLQEGFADPEGGAALIAAGTGLGEAILTQHGGRLHARATEGGHASFAPVDERMDALLRWLRTQFGHVSAERVVSGTGLESLYRFFHDPVRGGANPHLGADADVAAEVASEATGGSCAACREAFGLFLRCYGVEAGNLALKAGATAGLYIGGGIAAKNVEAMKDGRFIEGFLDKGRFRSYLERIPVRVIVNEDTSLFGAALAAARAAGRIR